MFTCLYHLWDWIESPLFCTSMEGKKLQNMQQQAAGVQAHLMQNQHKKMPMASYQTIGNSLNAAVFQASPQTAQAQHATYMQKAYQPSPVDIQPNIRTNNNIYGTNEKIYQSQGERGFQLTNRTHYQTPAEAQSMAIQQQYQHHIQQQRVYAYRQQQQQQAQHHQQQQQYHHRMPPQSLNLSSPFQPANGPLKINSGNTPQSNPLYQQYMLHQGNTQLLPPQQKPKPIMDSIIPSTGSSTEQSPVYIQQNHPGHVVNQACQTQMSSGGNTPITQKKTESAESSDPTTSPSTKSPEHLNLDRKKSSGSAQALKLPLQISKRPSTASVTLSGWLYKQGSDGLKVWRKRWFVLAEYCLYYYKGPEEDKVLGAVLLPSYKVSACLPEDKIYRKYAFKCEHTNMRTYWLAAENIETMINWVKALTAATTMENLGTFSVAAINSGGESSTQSEQNSSSTNSQSQPSVSSLNQSGDNSDSGIHTLQSQQSKMSDFPSAGNNQQQPLYANAPPKPRRSQDGGYSSPSPDMSNEIRTKKVVNQRSSGVMSPTLQQQLQKRVQHHAIYDTQTGNVTSTTFTNNNFQGSMDNLSSPPPGPAPFNLYQQNNNSDIEEQMALLGMSPRSPPVAAPQRLVGGDELYGDRDLYMQKLLQQRYSTQMAQNAVVSMMNNSFPVANERRTPDAYGRSKNPMPFSDYEDIYNVQAAIGHQQAMKQQQELGTYRRPMSPSAYDAQKIVQGVTPRYTPNHMEQSQIPYRSRPPTAASIVRPHSADFLEYEARAEAAAEAAEIAALSAIKPDPVRASGQVPRPKSSLDINRGPDSLYYSEASYAEKMRQSALYLQKPQQQPQQQQGMMYPGMNHTIGGYENPYDRQQQYNMNQGNSMPRITRSNTNTNILAESRLNMQQPRDYYIRNASNMASTGTPNVSQQQSVANDQFLRSASARLPKRGDEESEGVLSPPSSTNLSLSSPNSTLKDGERKREESMKRLLEWKQRMLQSPLTRKSVQQNGNNSSLSVMNKLGVVGSETAPSIQHHQRRRSESHAGYNSYSSDDEASISIRNVGNLPKNNLIVKPAHDALQYQHSIYGSKQQLLTPQPPSAAAPYYGIGGVNYYGLGGSTMNIRSNYDYRDNYNYHPLRKTGSRAEIDMLERETSSQIRNLDMSAGDLLSRTHEELVLLLIQLRRQSSFIARAIEQCCTDIHDVQNRLRTSQGLTRAESIQRLDQLKQHLIDLERQYDKSKPMVNLVDNMVKLGSLYRSNDSSTSISRMNDPTAIERYEFNQRLQEKRMLAEEEKQFERQHASQKELQSKVRQLYQLDHLLQEESGTLQNLQRDKEDLERALGGLKNRLQDTNGPPVVMEAARKQQNILEIELSRVHQLLADNSKKLEQTVAGNARLEQELLVLRQKLQSSRGSQSHLGSSTTLNVDNSPYPNSTTALLESELKRVQNLVGNMQRQRQDLSQAVKQLTENSNRLYHDLDVKGEKSKKRHNSGSWMETDLDGSADRYDRSNMSTPLFVDTKTNDDIYDEEKNLQAGYCNGGLDNDDFLDNNPFASMVNQEKPEIKTVRIVKRESERRQRDRERTTSSSLSTSNLNLDQVIEEDNNYLQDEIYALRSRSLPRNNDIYDSYLKASSNRNSGRSAYSRYSDYFGGPTSLISPTNNPYPVSLTDNSVYVQPTTAYTGTAYQISEALRSKTESMQSLNKSLTELTPSFQSEAAKLIMSEMSAGSASEDNANNDKVPASYKHKRVVPREKRRHFTAPNNVNKAAMENVQCENDMNKNNVNWRARDDLDMEVALRPRMNAPDVVRSALAQGEKISENTIDKLFGAPSKIVIPERYIPEKAPELSPEEKRKRQEKVEAIKKMLSEAPINASNDSPTDHPPSKITEEKKQREHLLQLNQILAQQVMQMSKIVAGNPSQSNEK
ncbi:PLEKHA5 family protein [Megaselia abdita]